MPAGLKHQDAPSSQPLLIEQGQRHAGVDMPPTRLFETSEGDRFFLGKRFDRRTLTTVDLISITFAALPRLIEIRLRRAGLTLTAQAAMQQMRQLHSVLMCLPGQKTPERLLEGPDEVQTQILNAFGREIKNGVLQECKQ